MSPVDDSEERASNTAKQGAAAADKKSPALSTALAKTTAIQTYAQAAGQGDAGAQLALGLALLSGENATRDVERGRYWLQRAASQGNAQAQYTLGDIYINGRGVEREQAWGAHWMWRSAAAGYPPAQQMMGILLANGLGLEQNYDAAWVWSKLAADQGVEGAGPLLKKLTAKQDSAMLPYLQKQVEQWLATPERHNPARGLIRFVQRSLNRLGYGAGMANGWMGTQTELALGLYRRDQGLSETAHLGFDNEVLVSLRHSIRLLEVQALDE